MTSREIVPTGDNLDKVRRAKRVVAKHLVANQLVASFSTGLSATEQRVFDDDQYNILNEDDIITKRFIRITEWQQEVKIREPLFYDLGCGMWPLPEDLSPEVVDVLSKILAVCLVGRLYTDDNDGARTARIAFDCAERDGLHCKDNFNTEEIYNIITKYETDLVHNFHPLKLHPFFATGDMEIVGDHMYIWICAAYVYSTHVMSQTGFWETTFNVRADITHDIRTCIGTLEHPRKMNVAKPVVSARTNRKMSMNRWKSAIRMQIKLNRMHRVETAKNIVESIRRQKVRRAAEAAKAARKEAPFSVRGASGPAPSAPKHAEMPSVGDQAKRECHKAESVERMNEHRLWLQEQESLRLTQAEQRLEALRIASQIQDGDGW